MQKEFTIDNKEEFICKALNWSQQFAHISWLSDNDIAYPQSGFINILAVGKKTAIQGNYNTDAFEQLKAFHQNQWTFGYFGYDLKNNIENLTSQNEDKLNFHDFYFYQPHTLLFIESDKVTIIADQPEKVFNEINASTLIPAPSLSRINITQKISKEQYISKIEQIRQYIEEGEVYELNYCIDFFAENVETDPLQLFILLNKKSPMPFAVFQKIENQYLICASPERFLKKTGQKLLSQPIKGTSRRQADPEQDLKAMKDLRESEKEMAENMMIVDLVRNDLARTAKPGSVEVDEMFGIYSFKYVHQMISSISSTLREDIHFTEAIKWAFPMGSMTGAPKIRAMQLIEELENSKRGLFSGAVGYFTPGGDFDLNVVIRSIFYNAETKYLSFKVGGAITYDSDPEKEWEECYLKAAAIMDVLNKI